MPPGAFENCIFGLSRKLERSRFGLRDGNVLSNSLDAP